MFCRHISMYGRSKKEVQREFNYSTSCQSINWFSKIAMQSREKNTEHSPEQNDVCFYLCSLIFSDSRTNKTAVGFPSAGCTSLLRCTDLSKYEAIIAVARSISYYNIMPGDTIYSTSPVDLRKCQPCL
jgi:hypothetical protein